MKTNTLFQVRFKPSVKPPRGFTKSAHYNVTDKSHIHDTYKIGNTWLHASNFIKIEIEDAPVFQKPPLRKIASLKPDEVIECNTDAELKAVLEQAEREGLKWLTGYKPTEFTPFDPTPLYVCTMSNKDLAYFSKKPIDFTILPASKFVEVAAEAEPITQAHKDECLKLQERIKELEALCELRLKDQEGLADEAESYREANSICINRINRIESFAKAAIESNNDTLHKVALRAIANGEI